MIIITRDNKVSVSTLAGMSKKMFGNLVKAVVDIQKEIMAIDGEFHADEEVLLMGNGSKRKDVWGINLCPEFYGSDRFVEFDSMINLKPSQGNRTRGVDDPEIKKKIITIVEQLIINN